MRKKDIFRFKHFSVQQDLCAMKVGTDGVLLGAWAHIENGNNVLDAGTGTGLLALMIAQRCPDCKIDAIDVDEEAFTQAKINVQLFEAGKKKQTIQVIKSSLQNWADNSEKKYESLICNPPYFFNGFPVHEKARNNARVAGNLSGDDLLSSAKKILKETGSLQVIYPVQEGEIFLKRCSETGFYCKRITRVFAKENRPAKRILIEIVMHVCETSENNLVIEHAGQHNYSEDYKKLTKEYYLAF